MFKDEAKDWDAQLAKWERIEQSIVTALNADPVVKDVTRIMRIPDTFYWKKSGDAYLKGTKGVLKIKGLYKKIANSYSMDEVAEAFPFKEELTLYPQAMAGSNFKKYADSEKKDFFEKVNNLYPIEKRPSFNALISGDVGTIPPHFKSRNTALLITATLMRQAGWTLDRAVKHISKVGWHGMDREKGGPQEIFTTLQSAFNSGYVYSYKNELISHNMTDEEQRTIQEAYMGVLKERKEKDKVRFSNYEREIASKYPYIKKNEIGLVFDYHNGVYSLVPDQELENMVLNGLYEDMLWGYRTNRNVSDKISCLLSIIPDLVLTEDNGTIVNVKNGLLNIVTKELKPHTPDYVSLVQFPVEYDPNAKAPVWESCLSAWMEGPEKKEKTDLLQEFSGYCMFSSMQHDRALFLVGDGGNGKSTFVDTIAMVVGHDATSHIDLETLYGQYGMKGLIGKRLNVIEEVHGNYYQSNKLKKLVSGERVTIDIKYKDQFSFRPQAKFIFAVNIMPRMDDTSTATERRIAVVQFLNNFRKNPNTELRSGRGALAAELSGILNWMLEGAQRLNKNKKFTATMEQSEMLNEYRQENSSVEAFIAECLMFNAGATINARTLYDEYKKWCHEDGRKFKSNISFTKEIKAYGVRHGKFSFIERENGKEASRFEGVEVNHNWSDSARASHDFATFGHNHNSA